MEEKFKLITLRIENKDYEILKKTQKNLCMSINGIITQLIFSKNDINDQYKKSVKLREFKEKLRNIK